MSANSRQIDPTFLELVRRFTVLVADATILINRLARPREMIEALLRALQLFKEGRLGGVLASDQHFELNKIGGKNTAGIEQRRARFKERLATFGLELVTNEFLTRLPKRARRALVDYDGRFFTSLPELVLAQPGLETESLRRKNFGVQSLTVLEAALDELGLYIGMSLEEVADAFHTVPSREWLEESRRYHHDEEVQQDFTKLTEGLDLTQEERDALRHIWFLRNPDRYMADWELGQYVRSIVWKLRDTSP